MKDTKPFIDDVWNSLEKVIQHGFFLCVLAMPLAGLYFIATTIIDLIK